MLYGHLTIQTKLVDVTESLVTSVPITKLEEGRKEEVTVEDGRIERVTIEEVRTEEVTINEITIDESTL